MLGARQDNKELFNGNKFKGYVEPFFFVNTIQKVG